MAIKTVNLQQKFTATPKQLFAAWTDAAQVKRWLAPGAMKVSATQIQPEADGDFCIEMQDVAGGSAKVIGRFVALETGRGLTIDWQWQGADKHTQLTVSLKPLSASETEMHLTHGEFNTVGEMQNHENGWKICLDKLSKALSQP